jgi:iron complex outermembrane recepter protein
LRLTTSSLVALTLSSLFVGGSAAAQTAEPAAAEASSDIEGVVVTARRREELLQDVPLAITAFSGADLERNAITNLDDLPRVSPGFVVMPTAKGTSELSPTIRSQRQSTSNVAYDPSVLVYFAEVVQQVGAGLGSTLYDLSSVQVLKGPQGTLFGRNSTGGALLITPTPPAPDFGGYGRLTIGDYNLHAFEGAVNIPINDKLQVRISGRSIDHDGYTRSLSTGHEFDDEHTQAWRVSVRAEPTADITNTLVLDGLWDDAAGSTYKLIHVYPGSAADRARLGAELTRLNAADFHSTGSELPDNGEKIRNFSLSNITEWRISDDLTLKNVLGYRKLRSYLAADLDGSSANIIANYHDLWTEQVTEELQLLGTAADGNLSYIVGGYLFREKANDNSVVPVLGVASVRQSIVKNKSGSVFAQATYKLPFAPSVSVTAGARQNYDYRYLDTSGVRAGVCQLVTANVGGVPLNPCRKAVDKTFSKLTYNATVDWKIDENNLLYVAHRRGYRAGGFTNSASLPADFTPYRPEIVSDYEVGFKSSYHIFDGPARTNIAVYHQDYTDIQRLQIVYNNNVPSSYIVNAASATIKGGEIEQFWRPFHALELNLSYAYSKPEYDRFMVQTPTGLLNYAGAPFAGAPKHMASASARFQFPMLEDKGKLYLQISGSYQSEMVMADVTSYNPVTRTTYPFAIVPEFATGNIRLDWQDVFSKGVDLSFYVNNFTNKKYYVGGTDTQSLGVTAAFLGPPRTVGAVLNYKF